jgi:hypothetical protein
MGIGGAEGDRTLDLRIANATLSQLSYRPTRRAILASARNLATPQPITLLVRPGASDCSDTSVGALLAAAKPRQVGFLS